MMASNVICLLPHLDRVELVNGGELVASVSVPQAREGFSSYMRGRLAEDVPLYVQRIDAHCAVSQHLAAVRALDACYNASPPKGAIAIRRALAYAGVYYHHLEQLFFSRSSGDGGIAGLVRTDDELAAHDVLQALRRARDVVEILGGRGLTPERGIPGGVTVGIADEQLSLARDIASDLLGVALRSEEGFRAGGARWVEEQELSVPAYSLATVNDDGEASLCDGMLRIVDPKGSEVVTGDAIQVLSMMMEWKEDAPLRVGPLARLNAASGASTEQARELQKHLFDALGTSPIHRVAAGNWAMVIELVEAAELLSSALAGLAAGDSQLHASLDEPGEGVGAIEGARGTLIHRYLLDAEGIVQEAQIVSPDSLMEADVNAALSSLIAESGPEVTDDTIERIVNTIGSYQPAYVPSAPFSLRIVRRDADGRVSQEWRRP